MDDSDDVEDIDEDEARRRRWIGNRMKARRKALGLRDLDLANETGLSRSYITRLQNGLGLGSVHAMELLADALGCTVGYLLGEDDDPHPPNGNCLHCGRAATSGLPVQVRHDERIHIDDRFDLNFTGDSLTVQAGSGGTFIIQVRGEMLMVRAVPHGKTNGVRT
jgi:transcriptional regulator with XRE-family HTH domain